jgi:exoribonuclease-2
LFAIVSAFDAAYGAYADFQTNMERYWCLRWLEQHEARRVEAVVLKEEVLRLVDIPLIVRLPGMPAAPRGSQVRLDLLRWDDVELTVEARLIEVLQMEVDAGLAEEVLDEAVLDEPAEAMIEAGADAEMTTPTAEASVSGEANSVAAATDSVPQPDNR